VKTGNPQGWLDPNEPLETAKSISAMELKYAVLTMVDRDDLPDGGAEHVAKVFEKIRQLSPQTILEFLGGDFSEQESSLRQLLMAKPEVFAHNIETVRRLTPRVRDARAGYERSLRVLRSVKTMADYKVFTKSALMLGLGESIDEVKKSLEDLREHNVDFVTIGQYMRPSKRHLSIKEFVHPDIFKSLEEFCRSIGFLSVASGPLVRSSYRAREFYESALENMASQ
jgi:lipoic acid synthetase